MTTTKFFSPVRTQSKCLSHFVIDNGQINRQFHVTFHQSQGLFGYLTDHQNHCTYVQNRNVKISVRS